MDGGYTMAENTSSETFDSLLIYTQREGIDNLISWLHTTDFYEAPSSARYHGACKRGLIMHSLSVYDCAIALNKELQLGLSYDSLRICALLHDVCKVNCYKPDKRNVKITDNEETGEYHWETVDSYKFEEDYSFGGHGSKSVFLISKHIKLADEEAAAINCHMGSWDTPKYNIGDVYKKNRLAWVIHVADEMSTFLYDI